MVPCPRLALPIAAALVALVAVALALFPRVKRRRVLATLHAAQSRERLWSRNPLLSNISGTPTAPFITSQRLRELADGTFQHRSSDVWVVTYPKSGTTWVQAIVASLLGRRIEGVTPWHFERYCPWPERAVGGGLATPLDKLRALPSPRCLKSHWAAKDHMALEARGRVIFVMRNVLDVAVSSFHHYNDFLGFWGRSATWEEFWPLFALGDVMSGDYFAHLASWWPHRDDPDVLLLRYEELKKDPRQQIRRVAAFLGLPDEERLDEVVEATDFKRMRSLEEAFWPRLRRWLGLRKDFRMRSGRTGEGRTALTANERGALQQRYEETLEPLGVPWDWVMGSA